MPRSQTRPACAIAGILTLCVRLERQDEVLEDLVHLFEHQRAGETKTVVFGCLRTFALVDDREAVVERSQEFLLISFINEPANYFLSSFAHEACARAWGVVSTATAIFFHRVELSVQPAG